MQRIYRPRLAGRGRVCCLEGIFSYVFCNNLSCCTINIYIISSTASREGEGRLFGGEASSRARSPHWQLRSTGLNSVIISGALSRCLGSFIWRQGRPKNCFWDIFPKFEISSSLGHLYQNLFRSPFGLFWLQILCAILTPKIEDLGVWFSDKEIWASLLLRQCPKQFLGASSTDAVTN